MKKESLRLEQIRVIQNGAKILDNIRLNVFSGEILSVISQNNSDLTALLNTMTGRYVLDAGYIIQNGDPADIKSPDEAARFGIYHVGNESKILSNFSIEENLFSLNTNSGFIINTKKNIQRCVGLFEKFDLEFHPHTIVSELDYFQTVILKLLMAYVSGASIILVSDVSSENLSPRFDKFKDVLLRLSSEGISIIVFSGDVDLSRYISDRICVIRGGANAGNFIPAECDSHHLLRVAYGDKFKDIFRFTERELGPERLLECGFNYGGENGAYSFSLQEGEILGIFSIENDIKNFSIKDLFRAITKNKISLKLREKILSVRGISDAMDEGILFLQDDIENLFIFNNLTVGQNLALLFYNKTFFPFKHTAYIENEFFTRYGLPPDTVISDLTARQKYELLLYKYDLFAPALLVCFHPFAQLDDFVKSELYPYFLSLARKGAGIVLSTSNISEIVALCDRVMIIHKDRRPDFFSNSEFRTFDIENLYD